MQASHARVGELTRLGMEANIAAVSAQLLGLPHLELVESIRASFGNPSNKRLCQPVGTKSLTAQDHTALTALGQFDSPQCGIGLFR